MRQKGERAHTPSYYAKMIKGVKVDAYRVARIFGITDPPIFHALKKLLRFGAKDGQSKREDVEGAILCLRRWLEMEGEDLVAQMSQTFQEKDQNGG